MEAEPHEVSGESACVATNLSLYSAGLCKKLRLMSDVTGKECCDPSGSKLHCRLHSMFAGDDRAGLRHGRLAGLACCGADYFRCPAKNTLRFLISSAGAASSGRYRFLPEGKRDQHAVSSAFTPSSFITTMTGTGAHDSYILLLCL